MPSHSNLPIKHLHADAAAEAHAATVEYRRVRAERRQLRQDMRGDEHRLAHRADLAENRLHLPPGARVHARRRLVEDQ